VDKFLEVINDIVLNVFNYIRSKGPEKGVSCNVGETGVLKA
jgi:hypothetical protein